MSGVDHSFVLTPLNCHSPGQSGLCLDCIMQYLYVQYCCWHIWTHVQ